MSVLVWLFLALLLLSARLGAISSTLHLWVLAAHLSVTRSHLWIARHLILHVRLASRTSGSAHVAGVHLGLVSAHVAGVHLGLVSPHVPHVALISGLELVRVFFTVHSCSLAVMFSHVPGLVFNIRAFTAASSCTCVRAFTVVMAFIE